MTRPDPTNARHILGAAGPHAERGFPPVEDAEAGLARAVTRCLRPAA